MTLTRDAVPDTGGKWGPSVLADHAIIGFERTSRWIESARDSRPLVIVVFLDGGQDTSVDDTTDNWDKLAALNL